MTDAGDAGVLVTVAGVAGSTPREAGAKMLVTAQASYGTIGGGNLEHKAIEAARALLKEGASQAIERMPLGPELDQCCGGVAVLYLEKVEAPYPAWIGQVVSRDADARPAMLVSIIDEQSDTAPTRKLLVDADEHRGEIGEGLESIAIARARIVLNERPERLIESDLAAFSLLFEPLTRSTFDIALFGAGHVGQAVAAMLGEIPCRLHWIDGRAAQFPNDLPGHVRAILSNSPTQVVEQLPGGSYYLVMTHSHPLDQAICEGVLRRGDLEFLGLIGSQTKRNRFEKRLRQQGLSRTQLARLTCPIGVPGIDAKHPGAIAVAAVAQLLQLHESNSRSEPATVASIARG